MGYGITRATVHDGLLDHINAINAEKDNAITAIGRFLRNHPEHEADPDLTEARIALL